MTVRRGAGAGRSGTGAPVDVGADTRDVVLPRLGQAVGVEHLGVRAEAVRRVGAALIRVTAILPGAVWTDSWEGVDFPLDRFIKVEDIAESVFSAYSLSDTAVVEELLIRPQQGDF